MNSARRGVQPHTVGQSPVFVGVVGQDQGHFSLVLGCGAEARPVCCQLCHKIHPVALGAIGRDGALCGGIEKGFTLETDRAGEHAAVHFRQGYIHRDVAGR